MNNRFDFNIQTTRNYINIIIVLHFLPNANNNATNLLKKSSSVLLEPYHTSTTMYQHRILTVVTFIDISMWQI